MRSSTAIRSPTMKSGLTLPRIASSTRRPNRTRFSNEPPYSSSRWFVAGDQKPSMRWP